jgi:hypothetical protein
VSADEVTTEVVAPLSAEQGDTTEAVAVPGLGNVVSQAYNVGSSTSLRCEMPIDTGQTSAEPGCVVLSCTA